MKPAAFMKPVADNRTIWNEAAKSGLYLGLFTAIFLVLGIVLDNFSSSSSYALKITCSVISVFLWIIKVAGCLWLLRFLMLRFSFRYSGVTNQLSFRFGMLTALTSALIVAGANLCLMTPEKVQETVDMYFSMAPISDSDRVEMERILGYLPQISFFVNLIYCWLFGTVASRIYSSSIPPKDIFGNTENTGNGEDGEAFD